MKDLNELIKDVERDLVINLTLGLRRKKINKIEARNIAKDFMSGFEYKNKKDLFMKLNKLADKYGLVRKIYVKHAYVFENEKNEETLKLMRSYMKVNDFENAIKVAKGGE